MGQKLLLLLAFWAENCNFEEIAPFQHFLNLSDHVISCLILVGQCLPESFEMTTKEFVAMVSRFAPWASTFSTLAKNPTCFQVLSFNGSVCPSLSGSLAFKAHQQPKVTTVCSSHHLFGCKKCMQIWMTTSMQAQKAQQGSSSSLLTQKVKFFTSATRIFFFGTTACETRCLHHLNGLHKSPTTRLFVHSMEVCCEHWMVQSCCLHERFCTWW